MHRQQGANEFQQAALVGDRGIAARQLFHHQRIGNGIQASAAKCLGHSNAEQAQFTHLPVQRGGKTFVVIELFGQRTDRLVGKTAGHVADLQVSLRKLHCFFPFCCAMGKTFIAWVVFFFQLD
ncbi:hypothetical protein D3C87_1382840 [compost metagenome]